MKRENLEWQLNRASTELSSCEKQLDQEGIAAEGRALNPKWRNLSARCRQLRRRLIAVTRVEANNVEVTQRKEAKSAETASASQPLPHLLTVEPMSASARRSRATGGCFSER